MGLSHGERWDSRRWQKGETANHILRAFVRASMEPPGDESWDVLMPLLRNAITYASLDADFPVNEAIRASPCSSNSAFAWRRT